MFCFFNAVFSITVDKYGIAKPTSERTTVIVLDDMVSNVFVLHLINDGYFILQISATSAKLVPCRQKAITEQNSDTILKITIREKKSSHNVEYLLPPLFTSDHAFVNLFHKAGARFAVDTMLLNALSMHPHRDAYLHLLLKSFSDTFYGFLPTEDSFDAFHVAFPYIEIELRTGLYGHLGVKLNITQTQNGNFPGWGLEIGDTISSTFLVHVPYAYFIWTYDLCCCYY